MRAKRVTTSTLVALAFSIAITSPVALSGQRVTVGTLAGLSSSRLDGDYWRSRLGLAAALSLGVRLTGALSLHGDFMYVDRGTEGESEDFDMHASYFELPLYVRATLPWALLGIRASVLGGATVSWELRCTGQAVPPHIPEGPRPRPALLDCASMRTDRDDAGLLVGVGLHHNGGAGRIRMEARYAYGLTDIASAYEFVSVSNRTVLVALGVELPLQG